MNHRTDLARAGAFWLVIARFATMAAAAGCNIFSVNAASPAKGATLLEGSDKPGAIHAGRPGHFEYTMLMVDFL